MNQEGLEARELRLLALAERLETLANRLEAVVSKAEANIAYPMLYLEPVEEVQWMNVNGGFEALY